MDSIAKTLVFIAFSAVLFSCTNPPKPNLIETEPSLRVSSGKTIRHTNFPSKFVAARNIDVWLPDGYSDQKRYSVIYMHDGQMLFDTTITWNKQEWKADEVAGKLQKEETAHPFIIVGIWNNGDYRRSEYFPQAILNDIPEPDRTTFLYQFLMGVPRADVYLKFLVTELKPFIDSTYATKPEAEFNSLAGSSMGGLISLYALCEYPEVFGAAACLSMHSPMVNWSGSVEEHDAKAPFHFRNYLERKLPAANSKKIYIDRGDQTVDANYKLFQDRMDSVFVAKGWKEPHFVSRVYPGTDHSEKSWSARLDIPFLFLVGK